MSHPGYWMFAGLTWLLAFGWFRQCLKWLRHIGELPNLCDLPVRFPMPADKGNPWQLTVVVPACNEQASIAATLRSLLASEGIRAQIIAVNDRSTDRTGEIMERVAAEFDQGADRTGEAHRLQIIHIGELPAGWLGKPHAMACAADQAEAEWLLFTDGDVVFAPQALSLALAYAEMEKADHLVLMPDWTMSSHGEAAMHGAIHAFSSWTIRLWKVSDPKARDSLGVGAFNLVRRSTYEASGGFSSLRMEVLEDLRLGWKLKRAGYRQLLVLGPGLASVRWSEGALGVVRNLEKNLFALYRYRTLLAFAAAVGLLIQIVVPLVALGVGGWARAGALVLYGSVAGLYFASRRVTRVRPIYVLFYPIASGIFLFALVRSVGLALWRGGVIWRGTYYSLKDLRTHAGRFW